ncbi:XdhC family protein (plasmid) [Cupriavidus sp. KK10]|jgi:xanthine dehydrogenase accessory factor|uniref:XdhC family protein n=1 Tax=Cupriavidus sp. KK10 TaxID=1478019 RepID=UPI001BAD013F|nr:XdhC family protein [Cupriavidus sp. KK10]QUN32481.1 XdhC family protein [Cupriavidus sp. KK10]
MESVDLEVLRSSVRWQEQGHRCLLVTVVRTWGSSPRPAGAMLAVRDDGLVVGSVSGGCIEDDIIDRTRGEGIHNRGPEAIKYGISAEEAHRFGLPCGGTIELVAEPVSSASGLRELLGAVEAGRLVTRTLDMATGTATLGPATATDGLVFDGKSLLTIHGPRYRMLVIGAGQLSKYLCEIAVGLSFDVTVCDPREEYTETWTVPGVTMVRTMPDDTVVAMALDERCAVIALTHDPKLDDLALMEALRTPAFYVGALGSRRNNQARRERLTEFDLTGQQLARLRGPAGIYIGSRTPPEIAISILAEVVAARNHVSLPDVLKVERAKSALAIPGDLPQPGDLVCG